MSDLAPYSKPNPSGAGPSPRTLPPGDLPGALLVRTPVPTAQHVNEFKTLYESRFGIHLDESQALESLLSLVAIWKFQRLFRERIDEREASPDTRTP